MTEQPRAMRIGTWNLAGRWSARHKAALAAVDCDVWLLTEVASHTDLEGYQRHLSTRPMAEHRHWAGLLAREGLAFHPWAEDPHPASAAATIGGLTFCSSVLPWRACGIDEPWQGRTTAAKTEAATKAIQAALIPGSTVWGGDWNHALEGRETAGSLGGRQHINLALDALQLRAVTVELAHRIDGLRTIDHIAVPERAGLRAVRRIDMAADSKPLSDHDAYIVEAVLPPPASEWHVYVIEVIGLGTNEVYVGQSWHEPETRREQHAAGIRRGKVFKRPGVEVGSLRPDLVPPLPLLLTREDALTAERQVAAALRRQGITVHGGH